MARIKAVQRWNSFYKRMVKAGFNKKVALEGMSRGGLIVYNWAAQNPEKVACIYADAPVMDFKSGLWDKVNLPVPPWIRNNFSMLTVLKTKLEALNWKKESDRLCTDNGKSRNPHPARGR